MVLGEDFFSFFLPFFFFFLPFFPPFLPSPFLSSPCFPFWRTRSMASVHDHAYVCNDGKKGGRKTICALEWILLTVRRWKVGYLVELLARSLRGISYISDRIS